MDVTIIIPIYRRTEWIAQCINKLRAQIFSGYFEIIIVDDGSPNQTEMQRLVESFLAQSEICIKYYRKTHKGPAAARNYGVRVSSGEILCFLDDDSLATREWLREIALPFKNSEKIALVSGLTLSLNRKSSLPLLLEKAVYSGKTLATCNIAYKRSIFERLGGFDENFTEPSWEDNELGFRAKWAGHLHIYNEKAIVYHPHETSLSEYKEKCFLNGRGVFIFTRKYLFKKPLVGLTAPLLMCARLIYGFSPLTWIKRGNSVNFLKFIWSFYSIQGFLKLLIAKRYEKN